jgi:hypothetical protein
LSAGGHDVIVGETGGVRAAWTSLSTVTDFDAVAAGEDDNSDDVVEDERWGGSEGTGVSLAAAAPQVHF